MKVRSAEREGGRAKAHSDSMAGIWKSPKHPKCASENITREQQRTASTVCHAGMNARSKAERKARAKLMSLRARAENHNVVCNDLDTHASASKLSELMEWFAQ